MAGLRKMGDKLHAKFDVLRKEADDERRNRQKAEADLKNANQRANAPRNDDRRPPPRDNNAPGAKRQIFGGNQNNRR
jgi:uncharacterized coiled-coil DUF342 family protein